MSIQYLMQVLPLNFVPEACHEGFVNLCFCNWAFCPYSFTTVFEIAFRLLCYMNQRTKPSFFWREREREDVNSLCYAGPPRFKSLFFSESLHNWDTRLSLRIHEIGLRIPRFFLRALEYSGDGLFWIPITAALCWAPYFTLQPFIKSLLLGFMFDLAFIGTIKALIRRPRPVYNKGMYLVLSVDHFSFPSGHSSRAFLIFAFVLKYASEWKEAIFRGPRGAPTEVDDVSGYSEMLSFCIFPCLCACWATATASSRILLGRHFLLDVVAGSFLGLLEAMFVIRTLLPIQFFLDDQQRWILDHVHHLKEALLKSV